jgi:predicted acylesterase/phospholipase RssA
MHISNGKTALVLAGGGLTGAVYEIGALRAIDDLLIDRTVNDFDIYVGTSAGSLVSSFIASGVSPETMLQVIDGTYPKTVSIERKHIFSLNWMEYLQWGTRVPVKLIGAWSHFIRHINDMTFFDLLWSLSEALPSGLYDGKGLEDFIRQALASLDYSNNFADLPRELYIIATDLDTGERAVFGSGYNETAKISEAVAASSAMPMVYKPVRIGEHEYIDGGMRGTASIDLAIERGAKLVVCINPLVPFDNQSRESIPFLGEDGGHLSEKGVQSVANQMLRIMSHSGLHYHIKQLRRAHPEVDIILIEPSPEDYQMFFYNIMRYSARLIVARHGFESVTLDLAKDYPQLKSILTRHSIPISRRLVIEELAEIAQSNDDPEVIRRILEAKSPRCGRNRQDTPLCELTRALATLEMKLDQISETI